MNKLAKTHLSFSAAFPSPPQLLQPRAEWIWCPPENNINWNINMFLWFRTLDRTNALIKKEVLKNTGFCESFLSQLDFLMEIALCSYTLSSAHKISGCYQDDPLWEMLDDHLWVDSDSSDKNLPTSLHHVGPGQNHRVDRNPLVHLKPDRFKWHLGILHRPPIIENGGKRWAATSRKDLFQG